MRDQAERLRELAQKNKKNSEPTLPDRKVKNAKVLAVTSGKGGVGKSNISANLSIILSQQGKRVALFDADLGLANIDVILGVTPRYNLTHVVSGEKNLNEVLVEGPAGLKVIAGGSGVHELAQLNLEQIDKLTSNLSLLEEEMDLILVDTGAGLSKSVLNFVLAADEIIVVTMPEPTAIADAYGVIKAIFHHNQEAKVNLIINRVTNQKEAEKVAERIIQVCNQFIGKEIHWLGYVVEDTKISQAVRSQQPLVLAYPRCLASQCLQRIAEMINNNFLAGEKKMEVQSKNFFQKLFTLLR